MKAFGLLITVIALLGYRSPAVTYSGRIVTCEQQAVRSVRKVDVLLYTSSKHPNVIAQVKKVADLGKKMQESQSQIDANAFSSAYAKLEKMVTNTKTKVPATKSDERGLFHLTTTEADATGDGVILAIDLSIEDDLSAYGYQFIESSSEREMQIFLGSDGCGLSPVRH